MNKTLTNEEKARNVAEFNRSIYPLSLAFKDRRIETEYTERQVDILFTIRTFKILFAAMALLLLVRRVEALTLALFHIKTIALGINVQYINLGLIVSVCIIETAFAFFRKARILMGLFFLMYLFIVTHYLSYSVDSSQYCIVPT